MLINWYDITSTKYPTHTTAKEITNVSKNLSPGHVQMSQCNMEIPLGVEMAELKTTENKKNLIRTH